MLEYIDLEYIPDESDMICEFRVTPAEGVSFRKAAENVALESSIGTWTDVGTLNERIARTLKPSVYYMDEQAGYIKIAYPVDLFEPGNIPEILSSIAGNIFGMKILKYLRLVDVKFPEKIVKSFSGPEYGINGVRRILNVYDRPLAGTIVKPKLGLTEDEHAKVAYEAWYGGLDIVKDDENLTSMSFNKFEDRIIKTLDMRDKAESETGEKKIYMANVTAGLREMIKRAEFVKEHGGEYIMVDVITTGWSALQALRDENLKLVIHAHRAMHGALTRHPEHGVTMLVIAKICRLIGCDQLHIGTAGVGKMKGGKKEELAIEEAITTDRQPENPELHLVGQEWYGINTVFPVASGGLHPLLTPELIDIMGKDIIAQYGGGCHGHIDGTVAGAKAIRQSIDAAINGISLEEYAKTHKELARAFETWGKRIN